MVEYDEEIIATYLQVFEDRAREAKGKKPDKQGEEALRSAS